MEVLMEEIAWPVSRVGDLVEILAEHAGLLSRRGGVLADTIPQAPAFLSRASDSEIGRWIDASLQGVGLEAETISVGYTEIDKFLRQIHPIILIFSTEGRTDPARLVGVISTRGNKARILLPDRRIRWIKIELLSEMLSKPLETGLADEIDRLLVEAGTPTSVCLQARKAILRDQLGSVILQAGWFIRYSPGTPLGVQLHRSKLTWSAGGLIFIFLVQQLLGLLGWIIIGRGIFAGQFDWNWMAAWILVLLSTIPLGMIVNDIQAEISLSTGSIFKQRLLYGILNLKPDEIRHLGMGQFLGRVMESEAVEMLAFGGGFSAILSLIELGLAAYVLSKGAVGNLQAFLLIAWFGVVLLILWRNFSLSREWARAYREMTNELVENMVGHRTRLVQEKPSRWHEREDQSLNRYLKLSEQLDMSSLQLNSLAVRGWLILGMASLGWVFISGEAQLQALAVSVGGVMLASQAISHLVNGSQSLTALRIAWEQVGPLFNAADRLVEPPLMEGAFLPETPAGSKTFTLEDTQSEPRQDLARSLLTGKRLSYRYGTGSRPVIDEMALDIYPGDRILLEGPSGGGKSTLAALLTGLRDPDSGTLLLWGNDRRITGTHEWRRRVTMAPQFQENYVFSETLGFNLLMGRRWPATNDDLNLAEELLRELGLGDVFDRMPSGFQQMMGESGWQLSHGERSRLYIARTLLQGADLIILDESFAALDPENLSRALNCVLRRAQSLVVIAHP